MNETATTEAVAEMLPPAEDLGNVPFRPSYSRGVHWTVVSMTAAGAVSLFVQAAYIFSTADLPAYGLPPVGLGVFLGGGAIHEWAEYLYRPKSAPPAAMPT